ncbi:hypothetical protein M2336_003541 [Sphingobium sp. B1D7B]|uniref:hypothetical protein n=1 Tax=Sphingobium sp. B1D7B TaxID=2940578 RepID=UPI002225949C|nr:hypothetical protein [Sphingobium sp. B1D7B]MCW2406857.1 hypothetical protein [Sphingobium sp. B1D7B]
MSFVNRGKERQRLISIMDDYLAAVLARNFSGLKLAANFKHTENGVALPLGAGMVRTIRSKRPGGQYFVDVATGQVEHWGVVVEDAGEAIYGVRLRVNGLLISEIETLRVGNTEPYYFPDVILKEDPGFHEIIPADQRSSREELIEIANRYFDAIEHNDGSMVPVKGDCQRLVNGAEDTVADVSALGEGHEHRALSVRDQISGGHYAYIEGLRARRFPLIDEERGFVLAHVLFDHPGDLPGPNGSVPFGTPNSMVAFEIFKVKSKSVDAVWAICYSVPYGSASGWGEGSPRSAIDIS